MVHSDTEEALSTTTVLERSHRPPPAWLFLLLATPNGILTGGITGTLLSYLLRREGVAVDSIANELALINLPPMLYFLWSPLSDFWLRRRAWYLLSSLVAAVAVVIAFQLPNFSSPAAVALLVLAVAVMMLTSACFGGMAASLVPQDQKTKVSSMVQAGNVGGGALGAGGLIMLAQHMARPMLGLIGAAAVLLTSSVVLAVDEPPVNSDKDSPSFSSQLHEMWVEFKKTFLRWSSLPSLLLLLSPLGSGAAIDLLPGIAIDYGISGDQVAWLNGMAGGLLSAAGALLVVLLPKHTDPRLAYALLGIANALSIGVLCIGPTNPLTYLVGTVLYLLTVGACYAVFTALVLQVIGKAGRSGSSRYAIAVSLGNAPVAYMTAVDGLGSKWWGARGLSGIDMVVSGSVALAFLLWYFTLREAKPCSTAKPS